MGSLIDSARIFLLALFTLLISNLSYSNTDTALVWLKGQQQSDGSFHSSATKSSSVQSTLEAVFTLNQYANLQASVQVSANQFLLSKNLTDVESLSGLLRLNTNGMGSFVMPDFTVYKGFSGGYSDYPGYDDGVLGSSYLLLNGSRNVQGLLLPDLVGFLLAQQRADGSWAEENNQSSVFVTAIASRALQRQRMSFNVSRQIHTANQFLLSARNSTGIWNTQNESALALLAIIPTISNPEIYQSSVDYFMSLQIQNGAWASDVYTTALALQVSKLVSNPPEIENALSGNVSGFVKSQNSGEPIISSKILIEGPVIKEILSDSTGYFKAYNLPAGTYSFTFDAPGYASATQTVSLAAKDQLDAGTVKLATKSNVELIHGQVTDSVTGLPLSGVDIVFVGAKTHKQFTDENGHYAQEVEQGSWGIGFEKAGYHLITKTFTLSSNRQYEYSPRLRPTTQPLPPAGNFTGAVTDPTKTLVPPGTNNWYGAPVPIKLHPIAGAVIRETYSGASTVSDSNGGFSLPLTQGIIQIFIEKPGYKTKTLNGIIVDGQNIDYLIRLYPLTEIEEENGGSGGDENVPKTVRGYVVDTATNLGIPQASITIQGNTLHTDMSGAYEYTVEGISETLENIAVSASGYETTNFDLTLSQSATTRKDFPIKKIKLSQIQFEDLLLSKQSYQAYEDVSVTGKLKNTGSEADEVTIQAQILKQDGSILEEFTIHDQNDQETFTVNPDEIKSFAFNWFTQIYSPGQYSILFNVYSRSDAQLLLQQSVGFEILPTQHIASAKVVTNQNAVNQGASDQLDLLATVRNKSNIPVNLTLGYELVDPAGTSVWNSQSPVSINPQDLFPSVTLGKLNYVFTKSGTYELRITNVSGVSFDFTEKSVIRVIPDINIDLQQAITPEKTIPGADQKVRVKIRIEGKEVQ